MKMNKRLSAKPPDPQSAPLLIWAPPDFRDKLAPLSVHMVHPFWQILDRLLFVVAAAAAVISVINNCKQLERRC